MLHPSEIFYVNCHWTGCCMGVCTKLLWNEDCKTCIGCLFRSLSCSCCWVHLKRLPKVEITLQLDQMKWAKDIKAWSAAKYSNCEINCGHNTSQLSKSFSSTELMWWATEDEKEQILSKMDLIKVSKITSSCLRPYLAGLHTAPSLLLMHQPKNFPIFLLNYDRYQTGKPPAFSK